jgi:hypothetical protein
LFTLSTKRPEEHFQSLAFLWFFRFTLCNGDGDCAGIWSRWIDDL